MSTKEEVMTALDEVEDPELSLSIVELGLVYDVRFEDKDGVQHAEVDMTLTSPGCPAAAEIMAAAHRAALNAVGGVTPISVSFPNSSAWISSEDMR